MSFQITALEANRFTRFFAMSERQLADNMAVRMVADRKPGFPCRVSLADAEIGEDLILVNHQHQDVTSPYRAAHAIFVRVDAEQARPMVNEIPELFRTRALSLRAFDDRAMIVAADLVDGADLSCSLDRLMSNRNAAYIHIHFAKFGCYAARADRV